jgi:hypothetical protein
MLEMFRSQRESPKSHLKVIRFFHVRRNRMETLSLRLAFMHTRTRSRVQREYGPILHESNPSAIDRVKKEMDELRIAESAPGGDFQPDHRKG